MSNEQNNLRPILYSLIKRVLGNPRHDKNELAEWEFNCPSSSCKKDHDKFNLWFNPENNIYQCWKCKYRGDVHKLINEYGREDDIERLKIILPKTYFSVKKNALDLFDTTTTKRFEVKLPYGFKKLSWKIDSPIYKEALKYLLDRKVDMNMIEKNSIGYSEKGSMKNRIIFPSYDVDGNVNYYVARTFVNDSPTYTGPNSKKVPKSEIIFDEANINFDIPVYLVEGVFDKQPLYNCVPLLGKFPSTPLLRKLIEHKTRVIICLDEDAIKDTIELYIYLSGFGLDVYFVEVKSDISKYYEEYGKEALIKMLSVQKKMDLKIIMDLKFKITKKEKNPIDKKKLLEDFEKLKEQFKEIDKNEE